MTKHVLVVFSDPTEGREDEYNTWYDEVHLPEVLQIEGFVRAQRYKVSDLMPAVTDHAYLAIYEIETDDLAAAVQALRAAAGDFEMSEAFDASNPVTTWASQVSEPLEA